MKVEDIRKGDIVTYRDGRTNNVNKPYKYHYWFDDDFKNKHFGSYMDIMEIRRYIKFFNFYILKTIYKRRTNGR